MRRSEDLPLLSATSRRRWDDGALLHGRAQRGRLSTYRLVSPDARDRDNNDPPMEEVGFIFHNIRWCDEANHKEHADSWKEGGVR